MTIALSHTGLQRAVHDLDRAADRLRADHDDAQLHVSAFLDGGWTGEAAEAFTDAWARWRAGAHDVLDALVDTRRLLDAAHHDLTATDDRGGQRLQAVAARLGERLG